MIKENINRIFLTAIVLNTLLMGCASGPVTTQINTKKNPVVEKPRDFQSPIQAIDELSEDSGSNTQEKSLRANMLKALRQQQMSVAKELRETGRLQLEPGHSYEFDLESFCVNAGVERPVRGDGLFLGDVEGSAKSWLPTILQNYKGKGISQEDAQVLVWSLLSGNHFDQLSPRSRSALLKIFPDAAIRFGNSLAENRAQNLLLSQVPAELLTAKDQFDSYQETLQNATSTFEDLEIILSPQSTRNTAIDVGWLKHQDGYYIHLQADGYQKVHVKIYMPEGIRRAIFEPTKQVALPGQGQRLGLSSNVANEYSNYSNQLFKNLTGITAREAAFIDKNPIDALKIYRAAKQANRTTWNTLKSLNHYEDDNTDAFRHYVWAGLVTREIGPSKAKEFLNAHEDFPSNNASSKSMDLFNNGKGIDYASNYKGSEFEKDLVQSGLAKVRERSLRWIR